MLARAAAAAKSAAFSGGRATNVDCADSTRRRGLGTPKRCSDNGGREVARRQAARRDARSRDAGAAPIVSSSSDGQRGAAGEAGAGRVGEVLAVQSPAADEVPGDLPDREGIGVEALRERGDVAGRLVDGGQ